MARIGGCVVRILMQRRHEDEYCSVNISVWSAVSFRLCNASHSPNLSFCFCSVLGQLTGGHWYLSVRNFLNFLCSLVHCCRNSCLAEKNLSFLGGIKSLFFATHNNENVLWFFPLTFEHPIIMLFVAKRQSSQVKCKVTLKVNYTFSKSSKMKSFQKA